MPPKQCRSLLVTVLAGVLAFLTACSVTGSNVLVGTFSDVTVGTTSGPIPTDDASAGDVSLCLSGGGYRAILFHAGVIEDLNSRGLLHRLQRVSGVSGGAVAGAWLGTVWETLEFDDHGVATNLHNKFTEPLLEFTSHTIDVAEFVNTIVPLGSNTLSKAYDGGLFNGKQLSDLPDSQHGPRFLIIATELSSGFPWQFERQQMGNPQLGFLPAPNMLIADAVAASSAFPVAFRPVHVSFDAAKRRFPQLTSEELRDRLMQMLRDLGYDQKANELQNGKRQVSMEDAAKFQEALNRFYETVFARQIGSAVYLVDGGVYDNFASGQCNDNLLNIISSASLETIFKFDNEPKSLLDAMTQTVDRINTVRQRQIYKRIFDKSTRAVLEKPCKHDLSACNERTTIFANLTPLAKLEGLAEVSVPTRLKALTDDEKDRLIRWGKQQSAHEFQLIVQ
jgi:hypothetical protein